MRVRLKSRNIFCHESVSTKVSAEMTMNTSMMKIWDPMICSMAGQVSQVSVSIFILVLYLLDTQMMWSLRIRCQPRDDRKQGLSIGVNVRQDSFCVV